MHPDIAKPRGLAGLTGVSRPLATEEGKVCGDLLPGKPRPLSSAFYLYSTTANRYRYMRGRVHNCPLTSFANLMR